MRRRVMSFHVCCTSRVGQVGLLSFPTWLARYFKVQAWLAPILQTGTFLKMLRYAT